MFVFVIYFLYLCTEIQTNYLSLKFTRKEDIMNREIPLLGVIEPVFTEQNLDDTINGPWETIYYHYITNDKRFQDCSLITYLNHIYAISTFILSHRREHLISRLHDEVRMSFGSELTADIFGAVYYIIQKEGVKKCTSVELFLFAITKIVSFYTTEEDMPSPMSEWYKIIYEESKNRVIPYEIKFFSNSQQKKLSLDQKEIISDDATVPTVSIPQLPQTIFPGFTHLATMEHVAQLRETCTLSKKAARSVVLLLAEYDKEGIIDIHGWTKVRLFAELEKLNINSKLNNFFKAFYHKEDLMLRRK